MEEIDIKCYKKGKDCLLIITGIGGTVQGYQSKYNTIASEVIEKYKFSVMVATSPVGSWQHTKENLDYIMTLLRQYNFQNIYAMGTSIGANILLMHSHEHKQIKRILAINPILNINLHKINKGIASFNGKNIIICGENDISYQYKELINKKAEIIIIPKADHNFTNKLDKYIKLYEYLFNQK